MSQPTVRCNNCGWTAVETKGEKVNWCPNCQSAEYLMDAPWDNEIPAPKTATFLIDHTYQQEPPLHVSVSVGPNGILIYPAGYGDKTSEDGQGAPIAIEVNAGELRVICWGDINQEDPTHIIQMEGAREWNRKTPDDK